MKGEYFMSDEVRKRMERIAEAMDQIPEEEQEKVAFGIELLASYEKNRKTA